MRLAVRAIAATGALLASMVAMPATWAATDGSGPAVSVQRTSSYIVGSQVGDPVSSEPDGLELGFWNEGVTRQFTWNASDPSGICGYSVDEDHGVEGWYTGADHPTHLTTGQYSYYADEWENSDDLYQIRINVRDCAGNTTSVLRPAAFPAIEKDYGPTVPKGWSRTSCACAMGDSMLRTSTYHAALSTVVNGEGVNKHVALIMAKGPGRGQAAIYVDGTYVKTIDTYAPANTNRIVMWDRALAGTADHTIKVVNLATPGHPRIDIDGYVR
jgi:hypothetical protein